MVVSQLVETVEYKENKNIEKNDSDLEVCLYKIKLYDIHVLISLGKINKRYKKYNVGYCPVYLVIDENKIYQIGVYEFFHSELKKYLDDEKDLDITLLEGPLLYSFVDDVYIQNLMKDVELIKDYDEEEEIEREKKRKADEEEKQRQLDLQLKRLDDDDDNWIKMESESEDKKIQRNFRVTKNNLWVNNFFKNDKYGIKDNEGGGDCLFCTVRDAFQSIGVIASVSFLRDKLASNIPEEMYNTYKENYEMNMSSVKKDNEELDKIKEQGQNISKVYLKLKKELKSDKYKSDDMYQEKKKKIEEYKNYRKELEKLQEKKKQLMKDIENTSDLMSNFSFMKNINNLSNFRDYVRTSKFWADSSSISILEETFNFKFIILDSNNYKSGEYQNVLQCGDMVPKSIEKAKVFKPYYYIIIDHLPNHYTLINYDKKSLFRFHELPYGIRELVKNKCMNSKGKTLYDYIPKFKKYNGNDEALDKVDDVNKKESDVLEGEDEDVETTPSPSKDSDKLFNKDIKFSFYSKSKDAKPGKGNRETIPEKDIKRFEELGKIKDWRRTLSNFAISPFELGENKDGEKYKWNSVEHYYQGHKYRTTTKLFEMFSLNSKSELSRDPKLAKRAGGKGAASKKYRKELGFKDALLEDTFFKNKNDEKIMEDAQRAKYEQNAEAKKVLLLTKDALLEHIVARKKEGVVFYDTMRIRKELSKK